MMDQLVIVVMMLHMTLLYAHAQIIFNRFIMHPVVRNCKKIFMYISCFYIGTAIAQTYCTRTCVNGGVCNVVNGQQVCWCSLGFSGANCEIQG